MELIPTWLWFASGLFFLIVELNTVTFFFGIVGVGALIASLVDLFFAGEVPSFMAFILGSSLAAYIAWKFNIYSTAEEGIKTGADRLIDEKGIVQEEIDPAAGTGIVQVEGERWRAKTDDEEIISEDERVIVRNIEGTTLVVEKLTDSDKRSEEVAQ